MITRTRRSVSAFTVAERGCTVEETHLAEELAGRRRWHLCIDSVTSAVPSMMMKTSSPGSPDG